jgi:kelch-like protein 2/3
MNFCRRNAGVVAHAGMLFVIGGDDGTTNLSSVEVYSPETVKTITNFLFKKQT